MNQEANTLDQAEGLLFGEERVVEEATDQVVTFRLGHEWFGVRIASVREVVRVGQLTFLPSAPSHVAGVINLRGNILSVTDPQRLLGLNAALATNDSRIVVIEADGVETGLLVDDVGEVAAIPLSRFEPPLATLEPAQAEFVEHTCRWEERLIALLRPEKLLAPAK